jgi:GNAT superfamily N-acetyltransferase
MTVTVRPARRRDVPAVYRFIRDLAEYEKLLHAVRATERDIAELLFGAAPHASCEIAEVDGEPVGFALWFYSYSTFQGRFGLYLEDLYVRPQARGRGAGKALLAHLARVCVAQGLGRFDWSVLKWNAPSIGFYESLGARLIDEWSGCRLDGAALTALAQSDDREQAS